MLHLVSELRTFKSASLNPVALGSGIQGRSRRERLANVTTGIPPVLWWVVGLGAILNIMLIWMLNMEIHRGALSQLTYLQPLDLLPRRPTRNSQSPCRNNFETI